MKKQLKKRMEVYEHPITKETIFAYRAMAYEPSSKTEVYEECKFLIECGIIKPGTEVDNIVVEDCNSEFRDTSTLVRIEFKEANTVFITHSFKQSEPRYKCEY